MYNGFSGLAIGGPGLGTWDCGLRLCARGSGVGAAIGVVGSIAVALAIGVVVLPAIDVVISLAVGIVLFVNVADISWGCSPISATFCGKLTNTIVFNSFGIGFL